jgi:tetratricopeptide (TPR) repeat protein
VAPVDPLRALGDSLRAEIGGTGDGEVPAGEPEPAAAGATDLSRPDPDDTGMSWLDEVAAAPGPEKVIPDETGFFDLGAELEQELSAEGELSADELLVGPAEQSLEEIVEGFKRGVAENLSPEDYDTHFNLGIAYREMGLLDEAIGEFQLAAKEPSYLVTCASMLGLCFREKGLPELAVKWFRRGLEAPGISEEDRLGLLYDLGDAHAEAGERKAAYETFVDVYGVNTNYRDVVARLAELEPRR